MPKAQHNKISGLTLMALARVSNDVPWSKATKKSYTIRKGIMDYVDRVLGNPYAENSREQFRRQVLHQFVQGGVCTLNPDAADTPTNSSRYHYALTEEAHTACKAFDSPSWESAKNAFLAVAGSLSEKYSAARELEQVPLTLPDGTAFMLSPGKHNQVQAAIVMQFAPRFAPGSELLYLGDTTHKELIVSPAALEALGIALTLHDKMPDVVMYDRRRNWFFLVEAVTSHGPMSPKRVVELKAMLKDCKAGLVYVSAFPDLAEFKNHASNIAWDTEVWLADVPDHMMHFNGDRFLGPR